MDRRDAGGKRVSVEGFANAAVHDLRNPLAAVKLNLQALGRKPSDEKTERRIALALREVAGLERALEILGECGRSAAPEPCLPGNLLSAAGRACAERLAAVEVGLRVDAAPGLRPVQGHPERVPLAVAELAARLARRSEPGAELVLSARAGEGGARLAISVPGVPASPSGAAVFLLAERVAAECGGRFECDPGSGFLLELPYAS